VQKVSDLRRYGKTELVGRIDKIPGEGKAGKRDIPHSEKGQRFSHDKSLQLWSQLNYWPAHCCICIESL
jgi:hypothetical protein